MLSRKEVNWFVDHLAKAEGGADKTCELAETAQQLAKWLEIEFSHRAMTGAEFLENRGRIGAPKDAARAWLQGADLRSRLLTCWRERDEARSHLQEIANQATGGDYVYGALRAENERLQEKNAKLPKVAEAAENRRKNCLYAIEDGCLHESALHSALAAWKRER